MSSKGQAIAETPTVLVAAVEVTDGIYTIGTGLDIAKGITSAVGAVGEAVKPFIPLISVVTTVIAEIIEIYETAQYNGKICNSLMDRVDSAESAIKTLKRRIADNEKNFRNQEYYLAFIKFMDVMNRIKKFMLKISSLQGYKQFIHSKSINEKFDALVKDFDSAMTDLHFTMAVSDEKQRRLDQEALESDNAEMKKFLERIDGGIVNSNNTINVVLNEVSIMKEKLDNLNAADKNIQATNIKPTELSDGRPRTDFRGEICKKIYKESFEVACKPIDLQYDDDSTEAAKIRGHLAILGKLRDSPNIIRFYGLSFVDSTQVMVLEWAEYGSLRELYDEHDIPWHRKVQMALDICRGLTFLHSCEILHHDIRCDNIMITKKLDPKIANFNYSRTADGLTRDVKDVTEIIRWLAPEKLKNPKSRYTFKCEIFSFGMLLWELVFERIPYENWNTTKIKEHVSAGKREKITWGKAEPDIQKLQKDFARIIVSAWQNDPALRASLRDIFMDLDQLANEHCTLDKENILLPDKELDIDGSTRGISVSDETCDDFADCFDFEVPTTIPTIITIEEGIEAHKRNESKIAWKCFVAHANLGNSTAKYWKGYYLWEGIEVEEDRVEACKLFKEAADEGIASAQFRYAFTLMRNPSVKFDREVVLEYLTKAADNNNPTAQYSLGDIYLNGKLETDKDENLGKKYLRMAALNKQPKAIKVSKELGINIYADN